MSQLRALINNLIFLIIQLMEASNLQPRMLSLDLKFVMSHIRVSFK